MLDSKRDVSIKRYLSKVGKLAHDSRHFASKYYTITYNEELELSVRFSDHFHEEDSPKIGMDIVKTSFGFYTIRLLKAGISYTIADDSVLPYLKSILLVYPEINNTVTSLREATRIAVQTSTKSLEKAAASEAKLNKRDEFIDMVDQVYEENKILRTNISSLRGELNAIKSQLGNAKVSMEASKRKVTEKVKECEVLKNKLNKLKELLKSI